MSKTPEILSMKMPAGKYFVGDPCYMFDGMWDEVLRETNFYEKKYAGIRSPGGPELWLWGDSTAYGDGCYTDQDGNKYGVDAGLIGVTPMELNENHMSLSNLMDLGMIVNFLEPFLVSCKDGVFDIGHIHIDTRWDDEEDEEY